MTFYNAIRELKSRGWSFSKQYSNHEMWFKGEAWLRVPNNMLVVPRYVEQQIKNS